MLSPLKSAGRVEIDLDRRERAGRGIDRVGGHGAVELVDDVEEFSVRREFAVARAGAGCRRRLAGEAQLGGVRRSNV